MKINYLWLRLLSISYFVGNTFISLFFPSRLVYTVFLCAWGCLLIYASSRDSETLYKEGGFWPFFAGCLKHLALTIALFFGLKLFLGMEMDFIFNRLSPVTGNFYWLVWAYGIGVTFAWMSYYIQIPKTPFELSPRDVEEKTQKIINLKKFMVELKKKKREVGDIIPLTFAFATYVVYQRIFLVAAFCVCGGTNNTGVFVCFFGFLIILTNLASYQTFISYMEGKYGKNALKLLGFNGLVGTIISTARVIVPIGITGILTAVLAVDQVHKNDRRDTLERQGDENLRINVLNRSRVPGEELTPEKVVPTNTFESISKIFGRGDGNTTTTTNVNISFNKKK